MSFSITILAVGKKYAPLDEEAERYALLIRPHALVGMTVIKSPSPLESSAKEKLAQEGKALRSKWPAGAYPIALSEEGALMRSVRFSEWLNNLLQRHRKLVFTIGGAYGLSPALKGECREVISLSPLTLPHKLCMVVLIEQIYRAFTILHHHPYHK
jgi:23S rRNA (pseudouridine1915-N3)-methyltransferase